MRIRHVPSEYQVFEGLKIRASTELHQLHQLYHLYHLYHLKGEY